MEDTPTLTDKLAEISKWVVIITLPFLLGFVLGMIYLLYIIG